MRGVEFGRPYGTQVFTQDDSERLESVLPRPSKAWTGHPFIEAG